MKRAGVVAHSRSLTTQLSDRDLDGRVAGVVSGTWRSLTFFLFRLLAGFVCCRVAEVDVDLVLSVRVELDLLLD